MTILATTHPTLLDVTRRMNPQGSIDKIAEILHQVNDIIDDAVWIECNDGTGHKSTVRSGLPEPTWRKLYGGVQPTKSRTLQVRDTTGMLEAYAEVDKALADLNGNTKAFRLSEDSAHIEGMGQELASTLFYGSETTEPEAFTGFGPRFNDQSATNGENVLSDDAGGSSSTSIWLVVWSPDTAHMIYPKGMVAGLTMTDKGNVTIENVDGAGGRMEAYRSHYQWFAGLVVRDWRYVVRISLKPGDLTADVSSGPDLVDLMTQALELVPSLQRGRPAFYMNRKVRSFLRRQITSKVKQSTLTMDTVAGKKVMFFDEVPVRRCDAITNTEESL